MQHLYLVQLQRHQKPLEIVKQYTHLSKTALDTIVQFWLSFNTVSKTLSPFVSAFVKIMSRVKSSKTAIDPQFLMFLKQVLVKSGRLHFNIFQQQDAGGILDFISDELCGNFMCYCKLLQVRIRLTIRLFVLPREHC